MQKQLKNKYMMKTLIYDWKDKIDEKEAKVIASYCNSAMGIINELEIFSLVRERENEAEYVNLTEFIGKIFRECEEVLKQKFNLDLQLTDKTLTCRALPKELENAVMNLVVNAKNHCSSLIKLELYEKDGQAVIAVENDGDKVDESIKDTIYEPCVKANSNGSGLGLYTVKTVADKIDGNIALIDCYNTRFELSIPLAVAAQVKACDKYPTVNADYIRYVLENNNG